MKLYILSLLAAVSVTTASPIQDRSISKAEATTQRMMQKRDYPTDEEVCEHICGTTSATLGGYTYPGECVERCPGLLGPENGGKIDFTSCVADYRKHEKPCATPPFYTCMESTGPGLDPNLGYRCYYEPERFIPPVYYKKDMTDRAKLLSCTALYGADLEEPPRPKC